MKRNSKHKNTWVKAALLYTATNVKNMQTNLNTLFRYRELQMQIKT